MDCSHAVFVLSPIYKCRPSWFSRMQRTEETLFPLIGANPNLKGNKSHFLSSARCQRKPSRHAEAHRVHCQSNPSTCPKLTSVDLKICNFILPPSPLEPSSCQWDRGSCALLGPLQTLGATPLYRFRVVSWSGSKAAVDLSLITSSNSFIISSSAVPHLVLKLYCSRTVQKVQWYKWLFPSDRVFGLSFPLNRESCTGRKEEKISDNKEKSCLCGLHTRLHSVLQEHSERLSHERWALAWFFLLNSSYCYVQNSQVKGRQLASERKLNDKYTNLNTAWFFLVYMLCSKLPGQLEGPTTWIR